MVQQRPNPNPHPHRPSGLPFATRLLDANQSFSLAVDGSAAPIDFQFVPADDLTVTELALIFEGTGPIDFGDNFTFIKELANGIDIQLQSYGIDVVARFKTTRDLLEYTSPDGFYVASGGGRHIVKATRKFTQGLMLRDRTSDFIKLTVKDDLTKLTYGVASVMGYTV